MIGLLGVSTGSDAGDLLGLFGKFGPVEGTRVARLRYG